MAFDFKGIARCGAKTRKGTHCQGPAMRQNGRCRMHNRGARTVHGRGIASAKAERRKERAFVKEMQRLSDEILEALSPEKIADELFSDLKAKSQKNSFFSIHEFLEDRSISFEEFERIANSRKKFMRIWGNAESQAWENLQESLFTKSVPRKEIEKYIRKEDIFQGEDPEEIMRGLERAQLTLELHLTAIGDKKALKKYGKLSNNIDYEEVLIQSSILRGLW